MAVGKNKRLTKGGKKGQKKKIVDPFTRKEWYDVRAPVMFITRAICKTPVNKTAGTRIASDSLKGRVYEVSLADLQNDDHHQGGFLCRSEGGRQQAHPRLHRQGQREGVSVHLPSLRCVHQSSQGVEASTFRPRQVARVARRGQGRRCHGNGRGRGRLSP